MKHISLWLLATAILTFSAAAFAFDNEPDGWGGVTWNTPAKTFVKANRDLRKTIKLATIRKALETQDVILRLPTDLDGTPLDGQWFFGRDGLHTVVLRWQDRRPDAYDASDKFFARLAARWGPGKKIVDGELVWEGTRTRIVAKRAMAPTGSAVEIRITQIANSGTRGADEDDRRAPVKKAAPRRGRDLLGDGDDGLP
jgi:hypothetical protein